MSVIGNGGEYFTVKKILFIVEAMGGGIFSYIVDLANELVSNYDMYIAYAVRPQTPSDYETYFDKRIHLIEVKNFRRSINPIRDIKAFEEIKNIAKRIKPDIIHLHSSKAGALGRLAFNGNSIPLFYTLHGYSFLMLNQSAFKRKIYKSVEALCSKKNCMTISCSEGEHLETLKLTKNATYVNNGINVNKLKQMIDYSTEIKNHPFTVFTLGRICHQKNPELFNQIASMMPETRFLWIGDGELRNVLTAPNIKITGWVKREDALNYSINGDVFLLTSLWEGLPISLLESMFMKKLCVVSNVIGNHDVIHNAENGYVCDDISDYVRAISSVDTSSAYIERAYYDILNIYNTNTMASKYISIYETALEKKRESAK